MDRNDVELKSLRKENMKLLERIRLLEKDIEHLKQVNQRLLKRKKTVRSNGKAADNQMKCELIADKYKKLTGKDIKEDLENE